MENSKLDKGALGKRGFQVVSLDDEEETGQKSLRGAV